MNSIESFIAELAVRPSSQTVNNMYYGGTAEARIRRKNLHLYLKSMEHSRILLVGEAPGIEDAHKQVFRLQVRPLCCNREKRDTTFLALIGDIAKPY